VREFYAIDPATAADETQLNQKALLGRVLSVQKRTDDQPQILIYHTHSQETFADSIPGNAQTGIMGVGEVLAEILRKQYGYNVMHHMGQYDVEKREKFREFIPHGMHVKVWCMDFRELSIKGLRHAQKRNSFWKKKKRNKRNRKIMRLSTVRLTVLLPSMDMADFS